METACSVKYTIKSQQLRLWTEAGLYCRRNNLLCLFCKDAAPVRLSFYKTMWGTCIAELRSPCQFSFHKKEKTAFVLLKCSSLHNTNKRPERHSPAVIINYLSVIIIYTCTFPHRAWFKMQASSLHWFKCSTQLDATFLFNGMNKNKGLPVFTVPDTPLLHH